MTGPETPTSRSGARAMIAAAAALVVAVAIVVGLMLSGGGASGPTTTTVASRPAIPVAVKKVSRARSSLVPAGSGTLVATVTRATQMRSAPGGGHLIGKVATHTQFGSSQTVWVRRLSGAWLGVVSNLIGNNRIGWIPASAATLSRVHWEIKASLSKRMVTILHNGKAVEHYTVAVGKPTSPTPTGHFAVTDRLTTGDPQGPYGCCILALSALAPHAIPGWSGGNRIAIHSTPETSSIGHAVSHGCMRLTLAEGRWLLGRIPLGTPTVISA